MKSFVLPTGHGAELQEWTAFGLAMEALVIQCFEPDPDFTPPVPSPE
jgi:hypothetical protein